MKRTISEAGIAYIDISHHATNKVAGESKARTRTPKVKQGCDHVATLVIFFHHVLYIFYNNILVTV
jgi:hypothetical protein